MSHAVRIGALGVCVLFALLSGGPAAANQRRPLPNGGMSIDIVPPDPIAHNTGDKVTLTGIVWGFRFDVQGDHAGQRRDDWDSYLEQVSKGLKSGNAAIH